MRLTMRRLGHLAIALTCIALAACQSERREENSTRSAESSDRRKTVSARPTPPPPYSPRSNDVSWEGKQVAGRIAQSLTTYKPGATPQRVARRVATGEGAASLARMLEPVVRPGEWSTGSVVYPQLGGLTADAMSVMVVIRQRRDSGDGEATTGTRTFDVRLRLVGGRWQFAELASVGGTPAKRPSGISPAARAVLDSRRIELPDSARWDIYRGEVDEALLATMADAAKRHSYAVTVLKSGHPYEVFGTNRPSSHTAGYAVDIYAVDGSAVVEQRDAGSRAYELASSLYSGGVAQIGSPWILGAGSPTSFSDPVHQDHLHLQKQQVP